MASYILWTGLCVVFYTYIGYGVILGLMVFVKRKSRKTSPPASFQILPPVTVVVAAYNEESILRAKLENTLNLDYPKEKLRFIFVTDGSTDRSAEIVRSYPQVRHYHEPERKGKIHAVNRVMQYVQTPVTVFTDANTILNADAIRKMVRHYDIPRVGGIAGEKRIVSVEADNASGSGEGIYWKYESLLKQMDAEVHSIVGAAGELFSIRTALYEPPDENMIIEDFYLSMRIVSRGYRFLYEPNAYAIETASVSVEEEWKRKVRICAGAFQAMWRLAYILNPFRYGIVTFQYVSHRVLRWTLAPLALPLIFLSNLFLASKGIPVYQLLFAAQTGFYLLALVGYVLRDKRIAIKGFFVPYYFTVMNAAVYAGFIRLMRRKQNVTWEKARRAEWTPR